MKEFQVIVDGPDDVYPAETEIDALRHANKINIEFVAQCLEYGYGENTPMFVATVVHQSEMSDTHDGT